MDGEIRSIPGDRLVSRILTRSRRRPRMGLSPDFYARFGMDDPWNAPEIGGEQAPDGDGFVFLSAQPYYAMMRRLAAARKRREKRLAEFASRHAGTRLRAVARTWPGESAATFATSRLARLAIDDMTLPPPIPAAAPAEPEVAQMAGARPRWAGGRSTARVVRGADAWWSGATRATAEREAALVAAPGAGADRVATPARARAASHAGARLARAASASGETARALHAAMPAMTGRRSVARLAAIVDALPPEERAVEVRRLVRRLGGAAPIVRTVYEDAPAVRPVEVAAQRASAAPSAGLRPVLSRSPAMAIAAAPELDRAAAGTLAEAERSEDKRGLAHAPRRAAATRRAAARAEAGAPASAAVPSPVSYARAIADRPLAASPLASVPRTSSQPAAAGSAGYTPSAGASRAAGSMPSAAAVGGGSRRGAAAAADPTWSTIDWDLSAPAARPAQARASGRAAARVVAALDGGAPLAAPPLARLAAARAADGAFVAAAQLPVGTPPAERPWREPAAAHAADRLRAAEPTARSVLARAIPAGPDRVLAALPSVEAALADTTAPTLAASPVSRAVAARAGSARSAPIRTGDGAYVPAAVVAARATASGPAAARSVAPTASRVEARTFVTPAVPVASASATAAPVSAIVRAADRAVPPALRGRPAAALVGARLADRVAAADLGATVAAGAAPVGATGPAPSSRTAALAHRSPEMAAVAFAPSASADATTPDAGAERATRARPVSVRAAAAATRAASVAAADRATRTPLLAPSAARVLEAAAAPASTPRFARTGPLSWALPAPIAPADASVATTDAGTAPRAAASPVARGVRPVRAYAASDVAPTSAVAAPGGVFMSARAAARIAGARLLRTEAGRLVAIVAEPAAAGAGPVGTAARERVGSRPMAGGRSAVTTGAAFAQPFVVTPETAEGEGVVTPTAGRRRASEWAATRSRVAEATAYRGALRAGDADGTETNEAAVAPTRTPARRERPRRLSATAGEMALPTPSRAGAPTDEAGTPTEGATPAGRPGAARAAARRQPLEDRLAGVAAGQPGAGAPTWAARSDGRPMVRSPGGLFEALAKATTTEEIVRVIYSRADGVRETPLAQAAPVVQVVEQIRQEVRREEAATAAAEHATRAPRVATPEATTINPYVTPVPSRARTVRGTTRPIGATARGVTAGSGDDRIMKLVKKLQGLIHLAEMEGRLAEAKRQVRLAEDSPGARAEGQGPAGASREDGEKREKQDIEALGREVLEVVSRELEHRRMRRLEDHDESVWW